MTDNRFDFPSALVDTSAMRSLRENTPLSKASSANLVAEGAVAWGFAYLNEFLRI